MSFSLFWIWDGIGLLGAGLYFTSYFLLASLKVKGDSYLYISMNTAAASLVIISLIYSFNLSAFIIQAVWIAIGMFGLFRIYQRG